MAKSRLRTFRRAFLYAFLKSQKPFNPSATPSLSLILMGKLAEGFDFQTLQTLQQPFSHDQLRCKQTDSPQGLSQVKQGLD
ncbi:MAG: hypothetical protein ACI3YD_00565 [Alloprevotella sp.]